MEEHVEVQSAGAVLMHGEPLESIGSMSGLLRRGSISRVLKSIVYYEEA